MISPSVLTLQLAKVLKPILIEKGIKELIKYIYHPKSRDNHVLAKEEDIEELQKKVKRMNRGVSMFKWLFSATLVLIFILLFALFLLVWHFQSSVATKADVERIEKLILQKK